MSSKSRDNKIIVFDTEHHITGDICWCNPIYDERIDFFLHPLKFDKGTTISTTDREFRA